MRYDIEFKGETGRNHGVYLYDYAQFSGAEKRYQTTSVAGRLGELVGQDEYKTNLSIQCIFGILSRQSMSKITELKRWLRGIGNLIISDQPDIFYKAWKVNFGDIERNMRNFGQLTVTFTCTPYQFLKTGQEEIETITYNPYDLCRPIYKIIGSGAFALSVNGKQMTGTVSGTLTIDTERMIAYNSDGVNQSNLVAGDYEDLYIPEGDTTITLTGGTLTIIPQWGYDV